MNKLIENLFAIIGLTLFVTICYFMLVESITPSAVWWNVL